MKNTPHTHTQNGNGKHYFLINPPARQDGAQREKEQQPGGVHQQRRGTRPEQPTAHDWYSSSPPPAPIGEARKTFKITPENYTFFKIASESLGA